MQYLIGGNRVDYHKTKSNWGKRKQEILAEV